MAYDLANRGIPLERRSQLSLFPRYILLLLALISTISFATVIVLYDQSYAYKAGGLSDWGDRMALASVCTILRISQ